jgi:hypothetical protein
LVSFLWWVVRPKGIWTEERLIFVCLCRTSPEIGQSYVENAHLNVIKVANVLAFCRFHHSKQGARDTWDYVLSLFILAGV